MHNPSSSPEFSGVSVPCPPQGKCHVLNMVTHIYQINYRFEAVAIEVVPKMTRALCETSTSTDEFQPNPMLSFSPETISIATGKLESKMLDVQSCSWFARSTLVSTVCMRQSRGPETLPTSVDALRICHGMCAPRSKNSSPTCREADCSRPIH